MKAKAEKSDKAAKKKVVDNSDSDSDNNDKEKKKKKEADSVEDGKPKKDKHSSDSDSDSDNDKTPKKRTQIISCLILANKPIAKKPSREDVIDEATKPAGKKKSAGKAGADDQKKKGINRVVDFVASVKKPLHSSDSDEDDSEEDGKKKEQNKKLTKVKENGHSSDEEVESKPPAKFVDVKTKKYRPSDPIAEMMQKIDQDNMTQIVVDEVCINKDVSSFISTSYLTLERGKEVSVRKISEAEEGEI